MQYRLHTLLWTVFGFAIGLAIFRLMPMLMLSCILLIPLPALITLSCYRPIRTHLLTRRPRFLVALVCLTVVLFYVGMSGPLFVVFALPDQFPVPNESEHLKKLVNNVYAPIDFFGDVESHPLRNYQYWWLGHAEALFELRE